MKQTDNTFVENYIEATNTHNFDCLEPLIYSNAVYQFTDKKCVGSKEIRKYFEHAWQIIQDEKYSAVNITCVADTEDMKVFIYDYHYEGYHNGVFTSGGGKATNIFQKIDNEWKLILEHLN